MIKKVYTIFIIYIDFLIKKVYTFFIKNFVRCTMSISKAGEIKKRILSAEPGTVLSSVDFADIAEKSKVGVILSRLESEGVIRRVMRGIYDKPIYNAFLCENLAPSPSLVAEAIARNYGWTIVPCGDTALNRLGISTQVPAIWSYVSDGKYKEYSFDNTVIEFKKTTNKEISKLSYKSALVVQALKALGKENIDETVLNKLKNSLTSSEKKKLLKEAKTATSWVYEYIKEICRGENS